MPQSNLCTVVEMPAFFLFLSLSVMELMFSPVSHQLLCLGTASATVSLRIGSAHQSSLCVSARRLALLSLLYGRLLAIGCCLTVFPLEPFAPGHGVGQKQTMPQTVLH